MKSEVVATGSQGAIPAPPFFCYDAHNHLQDERFRGTQEAIMAMARMGGVRCMVVNGACESDWPEVMKLAHRYPEVIPSLGYHPWYLRERSAEWESTLESLLQKHPQTMVGEIGLDRWMLENPDRWRTYRGDTDAFVGDPPSMEEQESVFLSQLELACRWNRVASVHCLRAFGRLLELLESHPLPTRGFLLHSYAGPAEMIPSFARLGAYFSFPGSHLHARKERHGQMFRHVPRDRLLVETDAPDQLPPEAFRPHICLGSGEKVLNHPANLPVIHAGLAALLDMPTIDLVEQANANFRRLFLQDP